jgi:hypothetical protein
MSQASLERRRQERVSLKVPVRVQACEPGGKPWEAVARSVDVSPGGLSLHLDRPTRVGQVLHLSLALPPKLRRYDLTDPSYRVYGLVRHLARDADGGCRIGALFLGRQPLPESDALPIDLFRMPGDPAPVERRVHPRYVVRLALLLETEPGSGAAPARERAIAEEIGAWGALVRCATLPVDRGARLRVEEPDGHFRTRAEVRGSRLGDDGLRRLNLEFLDGPVPERLLPPIGAEEA